MYHHVAKQMNSRGMDILLFNAEDDFPKLETDYIQ